MSITLDLPDEVTADLLQRAKLAGQTPAAFVADALCRQFSLDALTDQQHLADIDWALAEKARAATGGNGRQRAATGGNGHPASGHSVLDIPAVKSGRLLRPFSAEDDRLGEMLEGRQ